MKYKSTRGDFDTESKLYTFEEVLFYGYAPDLGLFVPERIPKIEKSTLKDWKNEKLSYPDVVFRISRMFINPEEYPDKLLRESIEKAFSKFSIPEVIKIKEICKDNFFIKVAELFHGPTFAFKDLSLALVNQFLDYFTKKRNSHITVLVATSGDTGSAVIEAVKGLETVDVVVLYPGKGRISEIQELQLTTSLEENVHIFSGDGTSDDLDIPIKKCFPGENISSANSVNWARILVQIAHFVYLYLLEENEECHIAVPVGGGGNLSAGVIAHLMGVPVFLYAATNENDSVDLLLSKGQAHLGCKVIQTPANAMDISYPINIERILYFFSDSKTVIDIMENGCDTPSKNVLDQIRAIVKGSMRVDTKMILETVKKCWDEFSYPICPHSATALALCQTQLKKLGIGSVFLLATASPKKFYQTLTESGVPESEWDAFDLWNRLKNLPRRVPDEMKMGEDWHKILQAKIDKIHKKHLAKA